MSTKTDNIIIALDIISALFQLSLQAMEATNKVNSLIERARLENRDLTNEELAKLMADRKRLEEDWKRLAPAGDAP